MQYISINYFTGFSIKTINLFSTNFCQALDEKMPFLNYQYILLSWSITDCFYQCATISTGFILLLELELAHVEAIRHKDENNKFKKMGKKNPKME